MDKINCVKKITKGSLEPTGYEVSFDNTKFFNKFNQDKDIKIVGGRPPVLYNTAIRYNNYLVNVRKLINKELQTESL